MSRIYILILALLITRSICAQEVRIYRDIWGVPHIHANTSSDVMFGFAYAQAEDRLEAILQNYRKATGHMAEVFGEEYLSHDFRQRLWHHETIAQQRYNTLPLDVRTQIESFIAGLHKYMADHPDRVPPWAKKPQPHHIVALGRYIAFQSLLQQAKREYTQSDSLPDTGNQWALSPQRSAQNTAILCLDPFAVWDDTFRWYEAHLQGGDLHAFGFAIPGLPAFTIGHNQTLGWSALPGGPDCADIYKIALDSPIANRYKYDHTFRPILTDSMQINVRIDNTHAQRIQKYQRTHHGPILHRNTTHAFAYCLSLADEIGQIEQMYRMMTAADLKTFYAALQLAQNGPQRIMYADRYGNIAFLHAGRVPIRSEFHTWNQPVDGNTSETDWQGIHSQDDLVQIHNPPDGWLQDNDTYLGHIAKSGAYSSDRYPAYIANAMPNESLRSTRMRTLLTSSSRITQAEATAFAQDTYIINSAHWIRALNIASPKHMSDAQTQAITILNTWNGRANRESSGIVLYTQWQRFCKQQGRNLNTTQILSAQPLGNTTSQALVDALTQSVLHQQNTYNRLNVTLKEIQRFRRKDHSWPIAGNPNAIRAITTRPGPHIHNAVSGPSCTTVISFPRSGQIQAHSVVPFGQSDRPNSPHFTDQAERLFSQERLKSTQFGIATKSLTLHHTLVAPR